MSKSLTISGLTVSGLIIISKYKNKNLFFYRNTKNKFHRYEQNCNKIVLLIMCLNLLHERIYMLDLLIFKNILKKYHI